MALAHTIPLFLAPIVLDSDNGPHVRVTYADTSTTDITLGVSGGAAYYTLKDGSSEDLFEHLETQLEAATPDNWEFNLRTTDWWGRVQIFSLPDDEGIIQVRFLTSELTGEMLGFTSDSVAHTTSTTSTYRPSHMWCPDITATMNDPRDDVLVTSTRLASGYGVEETWGTRTFRTVMVPLISGAYIKTEYAADADHAGEEGADFTVGDPNVSLQSWLDRVRAPLPGPTPRIVFIVDRDTRSSKQPVYFADSRYLRSVKEWTGEPINESPLLYNLTAEFIHTV